MLSLRDLFLFVRKERMLGLSDPQARRAELLSPPRPGVPGKPVFGLLGQVSGGYG